MAGDLRRQAQPQYPASSCQGESQFALGRSGQSAWAIGVPAEMIWPTSIGRVESPEDYRRELQEITSLIERIAKEVPNG